MSDLSKTSFLNWKKEKIRITETTSKNVVPEELINDQATNNRYLSRASWTNLPTVTPCSDTTFVYGNLTVKVHA